MAAIPQDKEIATVAGHEERRRSVVDEINLEKNLEAK